tara:strand:+ start:1951 stop:6930 length:4980 start_codon:yes stop_codon:yes gene_type:complete
MLIQTNFIAGKMNKSVDERLVPVGEYVDALNVRLGSTEGTEIGAVENSRGNTPLTSLQYLNNDLSIEARCIGAFEDGMRETIYWFVHDASNISSASGAVSLIVSYNVNLEAVTYHVVSETVLNFNLSYLITGVNKIGDLLFFTDDFNPPRYINVSRLYNTDTVLIDPLEEETVSVIVKPPGFEDINGSTPLGQPFLVPFNNGTTADYMEDRFLCFAYRYRYTDGGYSATSLFTTSAFNPKIFDFSYETFKNEGMKNKYNSTRVHFSTGSIRVTEIQILYKDAASNNIYIIDRLNKAGQGIPDNSYSYLTFTNSKILSLLGSDELLRLYDNVPRLSQAQTIQGNRLMYGNYVDQYDITRVEGEGPIEIRYQAEPQTTAIGLQEYPIPGGTAGTYDIDPSNPGTIIPESVATFDLSLTPLPIEQGTFFVFQMAIENVASTNNGGPDVVGTLQTEQLLAMTFIADQTYITVDAMTSSQAFQNAIGTNALIQALLPYTNPTPPAYPPVFPFPPDSGFTLTDTFNSVIPYVWNDGGGGNSLLLINSSISSSCSAVPLAVFPPMSDICGASQQPILLKHFGDAGILTNTFSLQLPATLYYYDNGAGGITQQFQYFAFNIPESYAVMRLLGDVSSLHSQRDYEIGVVYMDEYARASTVLVNETNTVFFPASTSVNQNKIKVTLEHLPPYWAKHYKFVAKPSQGLYQTIWSALSFEQTGCLVAEECGPTPFLAEPGSYWFRLEGQSQNIVDVGDVLTVKRDAGGAVSAFVTAEVLDKEALYSGQINATNPPGVYIRLKADGWMATTGEVNPNINCLSTLAMQSALEGGGLPWNNMDEFNALHYPACPLPDFLSPALPASLPAGTIIRISVHNTRGGNDSPGGGASGCNTTNIEWDSGPITLTEAYNNIHEALLGINFQGLVSVATADVYDEMTISFDPVLYTLPAVPDPTWPFNTIIFIQEDVPGGVQSVCNQQNVPSCTVNPFSNHWPTARLRVQVNFSAGVFCFETEPGEPDPNIFYDASDLLDIDPKYGLHDSKRIWDPSTQTFSLAEGSVDQTLTSPLETVLDFYNCYSFGNGVESFRIEDRIDGRYFLLGERVLAVSNQDFKEADRFAGMTYSGVYSDSANSNNLNEFNLGLVNYKDLETSFGPIMKMHSRETDILILQEDRISYVLASKNVITDSTGGGAIASVPQILGTQIARIEEYGISFNPESFASWGSAMFFTDTKRGAVLMLRGASAGTDQLKVISSLGMRSWFRDQFSDQLTTQKLGGYDPYMDEYVLTANTIDIPLPLRRYPCGQQISQLNALETTTFIVDLGPVIGDVSVPYTISSGEITISVDWNGIVTSSGAVSTSGSFSFNKSAASPDFATVTLTPTNAGQGATYGVTFECPGELLITVIQVVVNSNDYAGQSIHTEYTWDDGVTPSPTIQNGISLVSTPPSSSYISQTGVRSTGGFPYNGASVTLKTRKIIPDTFDFDPSFHKFKILSSTVLYENNDADIAALLLATSTVIPINNPSPPLYTAEEIGTIEGGAFTIPESNQYLYLVWDLRIIRSSQLCYSAISALEACCDCTFTCGTCVFSKGQGTIEQACASNTATASASWSFNNTGAIPIIGDTVFGDPLSTCMPAIGVPIILPGYYLVGATMPSTASPLNWVRIGAGGVVTESGTC